MSSTTSTGPKMVRLDITRPQRSAAPEIPVVTWVQRALPS